MLEEPAGCTQRGPKSFVSSFGTTLILLRFAAPSPHRITAPRNSLLEQLPGPLYK